MVNMIAFRDSIKIYSIQIFSENYLFFCQYLHEKSCLEYVHFSDRRKQLYRSIYCKILYGIEKP